MSRVFRTYLWKEWREQRRLLGSLALGLSILVGLIVAFVDFKDVDVSFSYTWITTLCVAATILTVGPDLFARERRGQQLRFLERLPRGLAMAFRGKLTFFLLVISGAIAFGLGIAALGGLVFGDGVPPFAFNSWNWQAFGVVIVASLWVFAVSTWVPTAVTAAPLTALLLCLLALPFGVFYLLMGKEIPWPWPHYWPFLACIALGALISARVCFVSASARSRPRSLAVASCVGVGVLAFLPLNAWAGRAFWEWQNRPYALIDTTIGDNGRFAFLTFERREGRGDPLGGKKHGECYAMIMDLKTGERRFVGEGTRSYFSRNEDGKFDGPALEANRVVLISHGSNSPMQEFDMNSGELAGINHPAAPHTKDKPLTPEKFLGDDERVVARLGARSSLVKSSSELFVLDLRWGDREMISMKEDHHGFAQDDFFDSHIVMGHGRNSSPEATRFSLPTYCLRPCQTRPRWEMAVLDVPAGTLEFLDVEIPRDGWPVWHSPEEMIFFDPPHQLVRSNFETGEQSVLLNMEEFNQ